MSRPPSWSVLVAAVLQSTAPNVVRLTKALVERPLMSDKCTVFYLHVFRSQVDKSDSR